MIDKAKNQCCKCKHRWEDHPGPHTECPACGSIYAIWVNYSKWQPYTHTKQNKKEAR